ncbi:MAG TPA: alpha/beta hydrolase [Vicinamibacterales bacterium]|nr:alpha/beta hydrolase [Vicinamibacterales bacterium]
MTRLITVVALFGLLAAGPAVAEAQELSVTPDVVYGHKYGMALTFDVFTPTNANGAAVLNMVSGGWRSQWRPHEVSQRRYQGLLDAGFTVFAVRHGSSPKYVIPEIVPDVRRAVRYIRLNARRLGVDASRLGVWGGSAGGHLSLMLGNASDNGDPSSEDPVLRVSNRVAAVVAYFPPVDLRPLARGASPEITNTRFPALNFDRSEGSAYSPIVHVSADDPPTLLIHGDSDGLVDVSNSHEMFAALQEHGVVSEKIIIAGADHGFRGEDAVLANTAMVDWFVDHLGTRSTN